MRLHPKLIFDALFDEQGTLVWEEHAPCLNALGFDHPCPVWHCTTMTMNPDDALTSEEYASLAEIAKGLLATDVPHEHTEKLSRLGLITKRHGEYILTDEGQRQLARGR